MMRRECACFSERLAQPCVFPLSLYWRGGGVRGWTTGCPTPHPTLSPRTGRGKYGGGFTLIEVLVTLLLLALVLPLVMNGITSATSAASDARRRNEAAGLAEAQLDQVIATQAWVNQTQLPLQDFTVNGVNNWPDYHWLAVIQPWTQPSASGALQIQSNSATLSMYQIDLSVVWRAHNKDQTVTLSTLVYQRTTTQ